MFPTWIRMSIPPPSKGQPAHIPKVKRHSVYSRLFGNTMGRFLITLSPRPRSVLKRKIPWGQPQLMWHGIRLDMFIVNICLYIEIHSILFLVGKIHYIKSNYLVVILVDFSMSNFLFLWSMRHLMNRLWLAKYANPKIFPNQRILGFQWTVTSGVSPS